ncbi:hypothetical protein K431DRAFT_281176 [Polychaeton citri CBS 116435]|uniref:Uncharacterized protein n=1 Tax=Polychaeton citri CBS 116435 TaxID=1314669 RepID=A0A9P4QDG4_9PEZI|nr:hypothetical protein K431DRAFT_281176 [Polychaeton citri CBS 116435]
MGTCTVAYWIKTVIILPIASVTVNPRNTKKAQDFCDRRPSVQPRNTSDGDVVNNTSRMPLRYTILDLFGSRCRDRVADGFLQS